MREVLAHALALVQRLQRVGRHVGGLGPEGHVAEDAAHQGLHNTHRGKPIAKGLVPVAHAGELMIVIEQARRRLSRAEEALRKSEEAGKGKEFLESWRATIEIERRNIAMLEAQDLGSPTPALTSADKARLEQARRK